MKNLMKTLLTATVLIGLLNVSAVADIKKGQKHYLKTFKSKFKMNGVKFATLHTQDEWRALFENNAEGFINEFSERYPKAQKLLNNPKSWKKIQHVRDFAIEYASDSGNVPSCG